MKSTIQTEFLSMEKDDIYQLSETLHLVHHRYVIRITCDQDSNIVVIQKSIA